ncbi:hypothetical protein [Persicitalea jodogahamensis]|uniref:hypothetical protein n=1 Tax=Persicitalea jodogahamensis TaxID=402147 RepID=UPI001672EA92|nr:hypothetical protein [Persicitalea jodogahamensis]
MKRTLFIILALVFLSSNLFAQPAFPVKAFSIFAPTSANLDAFISFIEKELAPKGINTLVLQIDHHYMYESRPELRSSRLMESQNCDPARYRKRKSKNWWRFAESTASS